MEFTDGSIPEKEVDEDIVIFLEHSVFDLYYLQKVGLHFLYLIEEAEDINEFMFLAGVLSPE